jgi:hypothetical protein
MVMTTAMMMLWGGEGIHGPGTMVLLGMRITMEIMAGLGARSESPESLQSGEVRYLTDVHETTHFRMSTTTLRLPFPVKNGSRLDRTERRAGTGMGVETDRSQGRVLRLLWTILNRRMFQDERNLSTKM